MKHRFEHDQIQNLLNSLAPLIGICDKGTFGKFSFPAGPATICTVDFDGPVGIEEMDVLLAHVAFYKTILPEDTNRAVTKSDVKQIFSDALGIAFAPEPDPEDKEGGTQ